MPGRPSKLTVEVMKRITGAVSEGNYPEVAARACGISKTTFYNWMKRGREAKAGRFWEFSDAEKKARAEAEKEAVGIVLRAAPKTWQAAAWWLERNFPERWGKPVRDQEERIRRLETAASSLRDNGKTVHSASHFCRSR